MSGTVRRIMRGMLRKFGTKRTALTGTPVVGSRRAGMHQAAEHEYRRSVMADGGPEPETPEEALEMPAEMESEIPPEEEDDEAVEMVAEGEIAIEPEAEILEEIADPESSENEENEETIVSDNLSAHRANMAVSYTDERIPELSAPVSAPSAPDTPLVYSPGDGSLKEIQEPLPGLGERYGIAPKVDGVEDPSANVAAYEAPEPEPEPDPEPDPEPEVPAETPAD